MTRTTLSKFGKCIKALFAGKNVSWHNLSEVQLDNAYQSHNDRDLIGLQLGKYAQRHV